MKLCSSLGIKLMNSCSVILPVPAIILASMGSLFFYPLCTQQTDSQSEFGAAPSNFRKSACSLGVPDLKSVFEEDCWLYSQRNEFKEELEREFLESQLDF